MKTIHPSHASPRWLAAVGRSLKTSRAVLGVLLFTPAVVAIPASSLAQTPATLTTLQNDGDYPRAGLIQGSDGNFYGTTGGSGSNYTGTVFKITPAGVLTTLHTFSSLDNNYVNSDGAYSQAALVQGRDGNFYGTTQQGGANSVGTVFKITPAGALTTLHTFSADDSSGTNSDGAKPQAALVQGSDGNLYGTAARGGTSDVGTVFKITPAGALTTLHIFSAVDNNGVNTDGAVPEAALVQGNDGNFYGTTKVGGASTGGTLFSITPAGAFTTLYTFSAINGDGFNSDGAEPLGALVLSRDGNFYGTTELGGGGGSGTVFKITPAGVLTTLYTFSQAGEDINDDGANPEGALVQGSDGNFYGTTKVGGYNGEGTIFKITPAGVLTTLYTFSAADPDLGTNSDGAGPDAPLVQGSDGSFYGTTTFGGSSDAGTVFKLTLLPSFFTGQVALLNGVDYLAFPDGNYFGYYSFLADAHYLYHFDLGYEYVFDAKDGKSGVYLYDFKSSTFFYTSPAFPFPYLYDFSLNTVLYYYPDPSNRGRYNTNGVRYFYDFGTGKIISK